MLEDSVQALALQLIKGFAIADHAREKKLCCKCIMALFYMRLIPKPIPDLLAPAYAGSAEIYFDSLLQPSVKLVHSHCC